MSNVNISKDKKILIINAGSSSIKFKVFNQKNFKVISSGICERIGISGHFTIKYYKNGKLEVYSKDIDLPNYEVSIKLVINSLIKYGVIKNINEFVGIGHRIVQGGDVFKDSAIIDAKSAKQIEKFIRLAPLHNKPELDVVNVFRKLLPKVKNVAAFDTSFHTTIPKINYTYPINVEVAKKHEIKRYGAHGTSYKYINQEMQKILKKKNVNLVVCHIGNGASICAIKDSKSYNTSMGLTPLEGLMMGTRCGDVDPSIIIYLIQQGMNVNEVNDIVNKKSGLLGMVKTNDMRDILQKIKKGNQYDFAVELYTKRIADYIIKYVNDLNKKVDGIIFTAGVAENNLAVIKKVIEKINLFKLDINSKLDNKYDFYRLISTPKSKFKIYQVRTDEELMIAKDVVRLSKK